MEKFQLARKQALKHFTTADHLTHTTYSLLQEPKLLVTILENLYNASSKAVDALIYREKYYKRIDPMVPSDFMARTEIFERITRSRETAQAIREIKELMEKRKASHMEFVRKDKYVMASDTYSMSTLDINQIKGFIRKLKPLFEYLNK